MSFTCDECRIKQGLEHGLGWPFMGISYGRCEDCGKTAECEDLHERLWKKKQPPDDALRGMSRKEPTLEDDFQTLAITFNRLRNRATSQPRLWKKINNLHRALLAIKEEFRLGGQL